MRNSKEKTDKIIHYMLGGLAIFLVSFVLLLCLGPIIIFGGGIELTPAFFLGLAACIGAGMLINHGYKDMKSVRFWQAIIVIAAWFAITVLLHHIH